MITTGAIEDGGVIGVSIHPANPIPPTIDKSITTKVANTAETERKRMNMIRIITPYIAGVRVVISFTPASLKALLSIVSPER